MTQSIKLHVETIPFLNISHYLNNILPIQSLEVENTAEEDSGSIEVRISSDIPCIEEYSANLATIPAANIVKIPLAELRINRNFLSSVLETEKAVLKIEILQNNVLETSEIVEIQVHPAEYFGGFIFLPELIATYITPNYGYVYHIKRKAVEIMEKYGFSAAFEGYQSDDSERVLQMMSAIYTAIQSEEIVYSALPPGYANIGQRLRLLPTIKQERFGNCIDISLLFAACFEAVNLNPIIIVTEGHAFVGCWLYDNKFPEIINDDKAAITKRLAKGIREIAVLETTTVCRGKEIDFMQALNIGEANLVGREDFLLSVDVKRARSARIRPIPLMTEATGVQLNENWLGKDDELKMSNKFNLGTIYEDDLLESTQPKSKQKIWERKLLDLSLRNNLLNMRMTRNMLQLVDIDISSLEDTLADGRSFSILPSPKADILRRYNLFVQALHESSPIYQTANDELKYFRLLTYYHQIDLDNILNYIHKNAKLSIEENGSSTLYLAVGLLKWYDRRTPDQARYAPILLLPVEISRRSVNSKYTLKSREEETLINITLLEFLRQEYQINLDVLDQLPYDEKGVDVPKVMGIIRRVIMQLKGWDVEEQLVLGNFSFSKLILWKDMTLNQEKLVESDIVRSLIEGRLTFSNPRQSDESVHFEEIPPNQLALPIPTDVSQMNAVLSAQQGNSFILHGPPGTGKSQTITNIIADALFHKKRVLFVAAKKAALDVVYNRLEQIGLGPFSLELHSNKSKKSDVLNQLERSLEAARIHENIDFQNESERLQHAKLAISDYVESLHERHSSGLSLFENIVELEILKAKKFQVDFISVDVLEKLDAVLLQKWKDWLYQMQEIVSQITHPKDNPFSKFKSKNNSILEKNAIETDSPKLLISLRKLQQINVSTVQALKFTESIESYSQMESFGKIIRLLSELPKTPIGFCAFLVDEDQKNNFENWQQHFKKQQTALKNIVGKFNRNILQLDISTIELQWRQAMQGWFLPRFFGKNKLKKQLALYRNSKWENDEQVELFFEEFNTWKDESRILEKEHYKEILKSLSWLYREDETDFLEIEKRSKILLEITENFREWNENAFGNWIFRWEESGVKNSDEISKSANEQSVNFLSEYNAIHSQFESYQTLTGLDFKAISGSGLWIENCIKLADKINTHLSQLNSWMHYQNIVKEGKSMYLDWFINDFENQTFEKSDLNEYFQFTLHNSLARQIISKHESLHLFNVGIFENKIEQYKQIAAEFREITRKELLLNLAERIPNPSREALQTSEIGILQRAIKNKGRGMSIRRLFDQIPMLLPRLAPCMLMSPISAAQYFDVSTEYFDLVIFDEASQLPTCESISALARAKQAIIVGDPKQMPPTAFFSSTKVDEENLEIEDLESILDDCLALSMPSLYLLRHYRSKHESLIAFSNANYYDNKLLTFPSADDINRKLMHHSVGGFYDKGRTRQNRQEAEAVVDFIYRHFENKKNVQKSIGVVTFSQVQQTLVEELLQNTFSKNPQLEKLATESDEPIFVKNLENVQGDERDIILFSICYAPDADGKMSMNFGPLNRNGGWRRLNVAVTRARYEMHIFATLRSESIDLSRTAAEGVAGLKSFLHYAETGNLALSAEMHFSAVSQAKSLTEVVKNRLEEKGLNIKCHIGTSDFKLDIGVVHPENPKQYILGILIDGKYYFDAQTTNDRELIMPSVLKVLGWNIFRIWTMDWVENSNRIVENILKKVDEIKNNTHNEAEPIIEIESEVVVEKVDELENTDELEETPVTRFFGYQSEKNTENVKTSQSETLQIPYESEILLPVSGRNSETIYELYNRDILKRQIQTIVDREAPISKNLLFKRILNAWNTARVSAKLESHLLGIIHSMHLQKTEHFQPFYWSETVTPDTINHYRSNQYEKRIVEDIAPEELVVAIVETVNQNLSIDKEELIRHINNLFGYLKVGKNIDTLLRYAIGMAVEKGLVKEESGRIGVK